jgi:hypothetical protein
MIARHSQRVIASQIQKVIPEGHCQKVADSPRRWVMLARIVIDL